MSFSIWMEIDTGGRDPAVVAEDMGYTYNISPMLRAAGIHTRDMNEKTGEELSPLLDLAISRMQLDPEKYEAMNPENGWGDYEGAVNCLRKILSACVRHPRARIRVC